MGRGANGPRPAEAALLEMASPDAKMTIAVWEEFLNCPDPKHRMTARVSTCGVSSSLTVKRLH